MAVVAVRLKKAKRRVVSVVVVQVQVIIQLLLVIRVNQILAVVVVVLDSEIVALVVLAVLVLSSFGIQQIRLSPQVAPLPRVVDILSTHSRHLENSRLARPIRPKVRPVHEVHQDRKAHHHL